MTFQQKQVGHTWVQLAHLSSHEEWELQQLYLAEFIPMTATVRVRFSAQDTPNNSRTEAGIDAIEIFDVQCE